MERHLPYWDYIGKRTPL